MHLVPESLQGTAPFTWPPLLTGAWLLATALLAPFWASCGFMLYISRRIELEAWDLELGLRALNQRLGGAGP